MRLPTFEDGRIDEAQAREMIAYGMAHGVNYFDTAYPYHNGESERVLGRLLAEYDRESYYLADKYPGHQILSNGYHPEEVFEEQLRRCNTDYFDFYLLHNVYEKSIEVYRDPQWGIVDYFKEQKRLGRIKHLGFSTHARLPFLREFLAGYGADMEFCQIQLNYLDWTLQNAKEKLELLNEYNIPVWVMEPVRGGRLAKLGESAEDRLRALRPDESTAAWAFRFLQNLPTVTMILSGMSSMEQIRDNVKTFSAEKPLSAAETALLLDIAEGLKNSVPCTACRYCCDGCPKALDIPALLAAYNDLQFAATVNTAMHIEFMPGEQKPSACIACGKCTQICPQNIDIPKALADMTARLAAMPTWTDICRRREEAQQ